MEAKEILEKYGASNIESYMLVNNYGYMFDLDGIRYDARFWANAYGVSLNRWSIGALTKGSDGKYIQMPKALREAMENELNA